MEDFGHARRTSGPPRASFRAPRRMVAIGLVLLSAVGVYAAPARAADPTPIELDGQGANADDPFYIQGRVQRPEVTVVIQRENLDRGFVLDLKESFLIRITEALRQAPF